MRQTDQQTFLQISPGSCAKRKLLLLLVYINSEGCCPEDYNIFINSLCELFAAGRVMQCASSSTVSAGSSAGSVAALSFHAAIAHGWLLTTSLTTTPPPSQDVGQNTWELWEIEAGGG